MKPTYFDFTVSDVATTRKFFANVFGWRFQKFEMPYEYYRIEAGAKDEPGIDGGIGSVKDAPAATGKPLTQVTTPVVNLDDFVTKVLANGGRLVEPKTPIPTIGWYATYAEPGGLLFGML